MQQQDLAADLTGLDRRGKPGKIVFHPVIVFPPGVLVVEYRGIVPLAAAPDRVEGHVLAAAGDTVDELPITQPFLALEIKFPAGAAIGLGNGVFSAILMGHAGALPDCQVFPALLSQQVDARTVQIPVLGHSCAADPDVVAQIVFIQNVTGNFHPILLTEIIHGLHEAFGEKLRDSSPVVVADLPALGTLKKQVGQHGDGVISPAGRKLRPKGIRPGQPGPSGGKEAVEITAIGLIGEKALQGLPKMGSEPLLIAVVGHFQEFFHRLRVQAVRWGKPIVPFAGGGQLPAQDDQAGPFGSSPLRRHEGKELLPFPMGKIFPHHAHTGRLLSQNGISRQDLQGQALGGKTLRVRGADGAAGASRGPLILVVDPDFQPLPAGAVDAGLHILHPFVGQIGCFQAFPGVDKGAAHAFLLHIFQLTDKLLRPQAVVPAPERRASVGAVRIFQILYQGFNGIYHSSLLAFRRTWDPKEVLPRRESTGQKDDIKIRWSSCWG